MCGTLRVFWHTKAGVVKVADLHLRMRIPSLGRFFEPVGRLLEILFHPAACEVVIGEFDLLFNGTWFRTDLIVRMSGSPYELASTLDARARKPRNANAGMANCW